MKALHNETDLLLLIRGYVYSKDCANAIFVERKEIKEVNFKLFLQPLVAWWTSLNNLPTCNIKPTPKNPPLMDLSVSIWNYRAISDDIEFLPTNVLRSITFSSLELDTANPETGTF